jgi:hypothetical protein
MATEDPEASNPSHAVHISLSRRLAETCVVTMVALWAGIYFTDFTLGHVPPGDSDEHRILRFMIMCSIHWLADFFYKRQRGV